MSKLMKLEMAEDKMVVQNDVAPAFTAEALDACWPAPVVLPSGHEPRRVFGCMTEPCRNKIHRRVKH